MPNDTKLDILSSKTKSVENTAEASITVPDVADVIEEILEKSNKVYKMTVLLQYVFAK